MLHALLAQATAFDGTVLLLAPVLGYGSSRQAGLMAPQARKWCKDIEASRPMPASRILLVVGRADAQCPNGLVRRLAKCWPLELCEGPADHSLAARTSMDVARTIEAALYGKVAHRA